MDAGPARRTPRWRMESRFGLCRILQGVLGLKSRELAHFARLLDLPVRQTSGKQVKVEFCL